MEYAERKCQEYLKNFKVNKQIAIEFNNGVSDFYIKTYNLGRNYYYEVYRISLKGDSKQLMTQSLSGHNKETLKRSVCSNIYFYSEKR